MKENISWLAFSVFFLPCRLEGKYGLFGRWHKLRFAKIASANETLFWFFCCFGAQHRYQATMRTFVYPRESGKNKQNSPYCNLKGTAALKFRFLLLSHRSISAIGKRAIRAVNGPKIGKKTFVCQMTFGSSISIAAWLRMERNEKENSQKITRHSFLFPLSIDVSHRWLRVFCAEKVPRKSSMPHKGILAQISLDLLSGQVLFAESMAK